MKKTDLLITDNVSGVNQILPHVNRWAWDMFMLGQANNWMPDHIKMDLDIAQWKSRSVLSQDERLIVKRCLGFFAGSESLVANNLLLSIFKHITDPECRQYILRQAYEEALHNLTVVYCCDSLNLDIQEVYQAYQSVASIQAKDEFLMGLTTDINRPDFTVTTDDGKRELLKNIFTYYIICEGIFFYSGFAMLLSLFNQQPPKMPGIGQQILYTLRDECVVKDSELLTPQGWKKIQDINIYTDRIAQYNEDGTISFVKPLKMSGSFQENVYRFTNKEKSIDIGVSENHRMIGVNTNKKSKNCGRHQIKVAKDMNYHPYLAYPVSGNLVDNDRRLSCFERYMIALQADGSIHNSGYHNGNRSGYLQASFHLTKQRKIDRLLDILKECGFDYTDDNKKPRKITVNTPLEYAKKTFNEWSFDLSTVGYTWCHEFIDEIRHWDGWTRKDSGTIGYGSTEKSNIDFVQSVAVMCGYSTNVYVAEDNRKESYKDYYRMSIVESTTRAGGSITKELQPYNDWVYGVEVPSGMIVCRYNDCISITGNSLHIEFGTRLINKIREQYPSVWSKQFETYLLSGLDNALELESAYAEEVLPNGVLGLNSSMFRQYIKYIASRRLTNLNMPNKYTEYKNPFGWMSGVIDIGKQRNFFETAVIEYSQEVVDDL